MYAVVTASTDLRTNGRKVLSWHFAEAAGTPAAARVLLRDGGSTGPIVVDIRLAASDSKAGAYSSSPGFTFPGGVYCEVALGTVRGSIDIA